MEKKDSIQDFINMGVESYMEKRVKDQIDWMSGKSSSNKIKYQSYKLLVIILSVSIPFVVSLLTDFPNLKYLAGLIGVVIAGIEGILSLYDYQNNWLNYRSTVETLQREQFLFATKTANYKDVEDGFSLFVERIEGILSAESKNWAKYSSDEAVIPKGKKA